MKPGKQNTSEEDLQDLGFGSRVSQQSRLRLLNHDGSFNVDRTGRSFLQSLDLYYTLLTMSWGKFYLSAFGIFCLINALFGVGFLLCGPNALKGVEGVTLAERFIDGFFFSVQTFTTIGYGDISPGSLAANLLVTVDSFVGLLSSALGTGLLFARFSRPVPKIAFSERAIITPYHDITAFEFRIANHRRSQLIEVEAKILLSRIEDAGGRKVRRYYPLELERNRVSFFPLAWTVVHPITSQSPMHGLSAQDLRETEAEFLILLTATDEAFSQMVHSRSSYQYDEVVWGAKFNDMFVPSDDGMLRVDLRRLDDYEPVDSESPVRV